MKIYRATVSFNNGDYNEWEEWSTINSEWYSNKELAEEHLPEMQKFLDDYCNDIEDKYHLHWVDPSIEEQEINDTYIPIDLREEYLRHGIRNRVNYIPYNGTYEVTEKYARILSNIYLTLRFGEYSFEAFIDLYDKRIKVYPELEEDTTYFSLEPSARQKMLSICKDEASKIMPYLNKEMSDEKRIAVCKKFGYTITK